MNTHLLLPATRFELSRQDRSDVVCGGWVRVPSIGYTEFEAAGLPVGSKYIETQHYSAPNKRRVFVLGHGDGRLSLGTFGFLEHVARTSTRAKQRCVLASFRGHLDELITSFHPEPRSRCLGVIWLCLLAVHTSQTVRSRKETGDAGDDIAAL